MADSALKRLADMTKPGRWFLAALEGAQEYRGSGRQDPGWFHPSSLGDECDARLAFSYLGAPAEEFIPARTKRIFDNGNARDLQLKEDSKRAGVSVIRSEAERAIVIPELHIRGELDDLVENPVTKRRYVVDYKTMRSDYWKLLEEVVPSHHIQVHPYMFAKGEFYGMVYYENKDTQDAKIMPANFDLKIWNEIRSRLTRILDGLDKGYVSRTPTSCTNCPYFANAVCSSNQIAQLKEQSGLF